MLSQKTKNLKQNKTEPTKLLGVLNMLFLIIVFGVGIGSILALFTIPSSAKGIHIVEPFSCEVALADYHHLTQSVKENNPQFIQEQLETSLKATIEALAEHSECEVQNGN